MKEVSVSLARSLCLKYHEGQFREISGLPYSSHPIAVAELLYDHGYKDDRTLAEALTHDLIEDTDMTCRLLQAYFDTEYAHDTHILSRNTVGDQTVLDLNAILPYPVNSFTPDLLYKLRLYHLGNERVQRIKIADMIDNTSDLEYQTPLYVSKKVNDSFTFYLPLAQRVAPTLGKELFEHVRPYVHQTPLERLLIAA